MGKKLRLFVVFSFFLLTTMCRSYSDGIPISAINGLSCRNYTAYFEDGLGTSKGLECYYACPDKTVGPLDFKVDPALSVTKGDLDRMYCGIAPQFTPTALSVSLSPTPVGSPTLALSPTAQASATAEIPVTAQLPLLTGGVTMCDTGVNLISFRIVQPPPDLTGKTLTAQIAEQESTCYVNPTNPSLMSCTIPTGVTFPARVVVSVDGAVVNDFVYDGLGCAQISTPIATTTP